MRAISKPLLALTADDLMSRDLIQLPEEMPLRDAARLLFQNQVSGAPVVNAVGQCVGFLSTTDFLRLAVKQADRSASWSAPPRTCPFQVEHRIRNSIEATLCLLPLGVCPVQTEQKSPEGGQWIVCGQPHCVFTDWQLSEGEAVRQFMTADPVAIPPATPIRVLADLMIDAHIHHLIVVDGKQRPIGIVSSTDVLSALAYADEEAERSAGERVCAREWETMKILHSEQNKWEDVGPPATEDYTELSVLVPTWQLGVLERAASLEGLTLGQLLRRLIGDYLAERQDP